MAITDDPDEWWASLSPKRRASIHRWMKPKRADPTPAELGMEPLLDETAKVRREAMPA